jgi:hypothetical protein
MTEQRSAGSMESWSHGVMESGWRSGELRDQLCLINLPFFCPVSEL